MNAKELNSILGGILSGSMKELKLEITCRVVGDGDGPKEAEVQSEPNMNGEPELESHCEVDDQDVPRPYSKVNRIDGIGGLAKFLGCAVSTAQKIKNRKEVPFYERGVRVYFYKDEIAAAIGGSAMLGRRSRRAASVGKTVSVDE